MRCAAGVLGLSFCCLPPVNANIPLCELRLFVVVYKHVMF